MSIASEKIKQNTKRTCLVRITPARFVSSDLAAQGSGIYTMTFSIAPLSKVEREGNVLTKVATVSNNDEWSHDESTGLFTIKLASAPNGTDNVVIAFYNLFYCDSTGEITYETPTDSSTTKRYWEPRITNSISTRQSFNNIVEGIFSISANSVDIDDSDLHFRSTYLGENDSFYKKEVSVWVYIGSIDNLQLVFKGGASSININNNNVSISVEDSFSRLLQPALMGDTADEAYFRREADSFPDTNPSDNLKPVPFIWGSSPARSKTISYGLIETGFYYHESELGGASLGYNEVTLLLPDETPAAVCTSFDDNISTSANRVWGLARTATNFKTLSLGTPSGSQINIKANTVGNNSGDESFVYHPEDTVTGSYVMSSWRATYSTADHNLEVGDSFQQISTSLYFFVTYVSEDKLTVRGLIKDRIGIGFGSSNPATTDFTMNQAPALVIHDNNTNQNYWPVYGLDFTYTISTTGGGNKYMKVTFVNDFENALDSAERRHPNMTTLHPSTHTVHYRVTQTNASNEARHDNVLKSIIEASGLTADATSFSAAGSGLNAKCQFSMPMIGEAGFSNYLVYAQEILKSTLGYVSANENGEIEYQLLEAPGSGDHVDSVDILNDDSINISYQDIATEIRATNIHNMSDYQSLTAVKESSNKAKKLHGLDNSIEMTHVLDDISGRISAILAIRSNRQAVYKFQVAASMIDKSLGDDLTASGDILHLGDIQNLKIISLDKGAESISVEALDLLGL
jgi:hypothetical protein